MATTPNRAARRPARTRPMRPERKAKQRADDIMICAQPEVSNRFLLQRPFSKTPSRRQSRHFRLLASLTRRSYQQVDANGKFLCLLDKLRRASAQIATVKL